MGESVPRPARGFTEQSRPEQASETSPHDEETQPEALSGLEHERARLTEIFRQSPNFMAVVQGRDHIFQFVNDAYGELVGARELIGLPVREALPEVEAQGFIDLLDRVLATGEPVRQNATPILLQRRPGEEPERRYVDFVYQALQDPGGSRVGVIAQGSDVTERQEAETHVRFQASLLDAVGEAVIATDLEGQVLYWNSAAEALYGWSRSEALGRSIVDLTPTDQGRPEARKIMAALQRGERWSGEFTVQRKGGDAFPAYVTNAPLTDADGNLVGIVGVSTDLTERKSLEEKLQQSQRMEAVGRMAGGIAHDFNNILTTIRGNAELLRDELQEQGTGVEGVKEIDRAAQRASDLTRQLLAFSRQQVLQPRVIPLDEVIEQTKGMLERLLREDIELSIHTPRVQSVRADPTQITQVILNLASNARDAMPDGGAFSIAIEDVEVPGEPAQASGDVPPGRWVCLVARDTGVGMDPATMRRIWDPFFSTKADGEGTGLGLPSVHGIVTQSGGVISVESKPGQGTTFRVYLPAAEETPSGASETADESGCDEAPEKAGTILLCEDQDPVRNIIRRVLMRGGHEVVEACSGAEALSTLEKGDRPFDLVITDVIMPGMSGRELVARIQESWPGVRVLLMSGYAREDVNSPESMELDVAFLRKPFSASELLKKVAAVLTRG